MLHCFSKGTCVIPWNVCRFKTKRWLWCVVLLWTFVFDLHPHYADASPRTTFYISEGLPRGSFVGNLSSVDFNVVPSPSPDFTVDTSTKVITTNIILDRETVANYNILLLDVHSGQHHRVLVNVTDSNDNTPRFSQAVYDWKFDEGFPVQRTLKAVDGDFGSNSTTRYSILSGNIGNMFELNEFTDRNGALCADLVLVSGKDLDRETRDSYLLNISAMDGGNPPRIGFTLLNITVGDVNDHKPVFENSSYSANTPENSVIGTSILKVFATDNDTGTNSDVEYSIERGSHSDPQRLFSVHPKTGVIVNNVRLDYEDISEYNIYVRAENPGTAVFSRARVAIHVLDENDNKPDILVLFELSGRYQVFEDAGFGTVVARIYVSDRDSGQNGEVYVTLEGGNGHFSAQSDPANNVDIIAVAKALDRETQATFTLKVVAKDRGQPQQTSEDGFILNVGDVNDNHPKFDQAIFKAMLSENATIGTQVVIAHATDRDLGSNAQLIYNISHLSQSVLYKAWFEIDPLTGEIRTAAPLDREKVQQPVLNVTVTDSGMPPLTANCTVVVTISDTNDNNPMFSRDAYYAVVTENSANGTRVTQVIATDIDSGMNGEVRYSLESQHIQVPFVVNATTGVVSTAGSIDHEHHPSYSLKVVATDGGGRDARSDLNISVEDVNDNYPVINPTTYDVAVYENLTVGDAVTSILAKDDDSGSFSRLSFSISSGNSDGIFYVNPLTGLVTLLKELDRETKDFHQFEVNATDGGGLRSKNSALVRVTVLDVNDEPPVFEPSSYNFTIVENSLVRSILGSVHASSKDLGTNADIYYSIKSGDVDSIFSINSTGTIFTQSEIDHERSPQLVLNIQARDGGSPPLYGFANVTVTVIDLNDNSPSFESSQIAISVLEDTRVGKVFYNVTANDPDSGSFGQVRYTLLSNPNDTFNLQQYTGALSLTHPIDFEGPRQYTIQVLAEDGGSPPLNGTSTLTLTVVDVNDHAPKFSNSTYTVHVMEWTVPPVPAGGTDILNVVATDADAGDNARISYSFQPGVDTTLFGLRSNGWIYVKQALDREQQEVYQFGVIAADQGNPPKSSTANVVVYVLDDNDNDPTFPSNRIYFSVQENRNNRTVVGQVSATDGDVGVNAEIVYSFVSPSAKFVIDSQTGIIRTNQMLDREAKSSYNLMVEARDQGAVPRKDEVTVTVSVEDTNDNSPTFRNHSYSKAVPEDVPVGSFVIRVVADDPDFGANGDISYNLTGGHVVAKTPMFGVDRQTGEITTAQRLDREQRDRYILFVVAEDHGSPAKDNIVMVSIDVLDVNDNPPRFVNNSFFVNVPEKFAVGSVVTAVTANDIDAGNNGKVRYTIDQGNAGSVFRINETSGVITLRRQLDYESKKKYRLRIMAKDQGQNSRSSFLFVTVYVLDSNDNRPTFDQNPVTVSLREGVPINFNVTRIIAHDHDSGQNSWIRYSIDSQSPGPPKFKVNPTTGVVQTIGAIDRESVDEYTLNIRATDQAFTESERLSSTVTVIIIVEDTNDNKPDFVSPEDTFVLEDEPFGYPIITITAIDRDSGTLNAGVRYSIVQGDSGKFSLEPNTGLLKLHGTLDYETKPNYTLNISATDKGSPSLASYQSLTIFVEDVNDNAPQFNQSLFLGEVHENEPVGSPVMRISADDPDSGSNGALTYNIPRGQVMPKFVIDRHSGIISTNSTLDREEKDVYDLTVYASDNAFPFRVATCTVKVMVLDKNDHAPVFNPSRLNLTVMENRVPFVFHVMAAQDPDIGQNGRLRYVINSGNEDLKFSVGTFTGELSTMSELDRERTPRYDLIVVASDITPPFYNSSAHVTILVGDVNDNRPKFLQPSYDVNIQELTPINSAIFNVTAIDGDLGLNGDVVYSLSNKTFGIFRIDSKTGVIYTQREFDFFVKREYVFNCYATDRGVVPRRDSAEVKITLTDENNHAPEFQQLPYRSAIPPTVSEGDLIATVSATDRDSASITQLSYRLVGSSFYFQLSSSGELRVKQGVSSIQNGTYVLNILADDGGNLTGRGIAEINVGQIMDNPPIFVNSTPANVSIPENSPKDHQVTRVIATRAGGSSGIVYSIIDGNDGNAFSINRESGVVTVANKAQLDFERVRYFRLQIIASLLSSRNAYLTLYVTLMDVNDNRPLFYPADIIVQLAEDDSLHSNGFNARTVAMVTTTDEDSDSNKQITYELLAGNVNKKFAINSQTGVITTDDLIDREERAFYDLVVKATDQGSPPLSSSSHVFVNVVDVNDKIPSFSGPYTADVDEDVKVGHVVTRIVAVDADETPNLVYSFDNGMSDQYNFHIDRFTGVVTILNSLDFELTPSFVLGVNVTDGMYQSQTTLTVNVQDVNDNAPTFLNSSYQATLSEETAAGTFILRVSAEDKDSGSNGRITYAFVSPISEFRIDGASGIISTAQKIEVGLQESLFFVVVSATDHGVPAQRAFVTVKIQISRTPKFNLPSYDASIPEDSKPGMTVLRVAASEINGTRISYFITNDQDSLFRISRRNGIIEVNKQRLDYEKDKNYLLLVKARDDNTNKSVVVGVNITVTDVNDNPPIFYPQKYVEEVTEDVSIGTTLLRVTATDRDSGSNGRVLYSIDTGNDDESFRIDSTTGEIITVKRLDYESMRRHSLSVQARDQGQNPMTRFTSVEIRVGDLNDNKPIFHIPSPLNVAVEENKPKGTPFYKVLAVDRDSGKNGELRYSIIGGTGEGLFDIDSESGMLTTNATFDYETRWLYDLEILAVDSGNPPLTNKANISVYIRSVDESNPVFVDPEYSFDIPGNAKIGEVVGQVSATDEDDGEDGVVLYSLSISTLDVFGINASSGVIFVNKSLEEMSSQRKRRSVDDNEGRFRSGRVRRDSDVKIVSLKIRADSGKSDSKYGTATAEVAIDFACAGCPATRAESGGDEGISGSALTLVIALAVVAGLIFIAFVVAMAAIYKRKKRKRGRPHSRSGFDGSFDPIAVYPSLNGNVNHVDSSLDNVSTPRGFPHERLPLNGPRDSPARATDSSSSPNSASSGRGSSDGVDFEVDHPAVFVKGDGGSLHSENYVKTMVGPDSGIQQDSDLASQLTISDASSVLHGEGLGIDKRPEKIDRILARIESQESLHVFGEEGGGEADGGVDVGNLLYAKLSEVDADEDESIIDGIRPFVDEGHDHPSYGGSLSSIVGSREELTGSYNWDYLLDWGPQFQPLADVFLEIGKMKDDSPPKKAMSMSLPSSKDSRDVPAGIVTTDMLSSVSSLPRSPISPPSTRYTSPAFSPNFTPAITPLVTRSPSVSPLDTGASSPAVSRAGTTPKSGSRPSSINVLRLRRDSNEGSNSDLTHSPSISDNESNLEIDV